MTASPEGALSPPSSSAAFEGDVLRLIGGRPHAVEVERSEGLAAIVRDGVNLCVWRRPLPLASRRAFERLARSGLENVDAVVAADRRALDAVLPPVGSDETALLVADVRALFERYVELIRPTRVRVQLCAMTTDACRLFHTDLVGVRMIVTYAGPGTEWCTNDNVDRVELRRTDLAPSARRLRDERRIRRVPLGAVALLKGEAWPGNRGNGLVHRSPPIEHSGARRLRLVLDEVEPSSWLCR